MKDNIKKIIYFIETPFDARDYERLGVDTLIENNFEVQVWDFTPFLYPNNYNDDTILGEKKNEIHRLFFLRRKALCAISNLDSSSLMNLTNIFSTKG